ncbi:aminodeoxychorismate/anthranilate synthase component II [uncultured Alloprevotella sp.]|uniref:anthranilate synthase component II n=1 Tax=uncultured Alloprevotella sp. TaxID=1283315 RepID=UPI00261B2217|nr:gamma-glutamyl-gamma-aminobutyrate hydrolase family protein [uncultured Alloprevotella sp.]
MKRVLLINQHDSFVYNLVQTFRKATPAIDCRVMDYDQLDEDEALTYDGLVLSPGPGLPEDFPRTLSLLRRWIDQPETRPLLGVCMGHQELGALWNCPCRPLPHPAHGISSTLKRTTPAPRLLQGTSAAVRVGRYHSWALEVTPAAPFIIDALTEEDDCLMMMHHSQLPLWGVQFHPESILTPEGGIMLANWAGLL